MEFYKITSPESNEISFGVHTINALVRLGVIEYSHSVDCEDTTIHYYTKS